jgi:hypothetical protein
LTVLKILNKNLISLMSKFKLKLRETVSVNQKMGQIHLKPQQTQRTKRKRSNARKTKTGKILSKR